MIFSENIINLNKKFPSYKNVYLTIYKIDIELSVLFYCDINYKLYNFDMLTLFTKKLQIILVSI